MDILILGGSVFLGRQLVEFAQARNQNVTLFNRGVRNPDLYPDVEKLRGDRNGDISSLEGKKFDVVIDTSGHIPGSVKKLAEMLKDSAGHYTFISSISAYKDFSENGINESSETAVVTDGNVNEMTMENYGALKVLCENAVSDVFKDRALNIRPGLIVGMNDWSDRFTYWIHSIDKGGEVLVPDTKDYHVQFIDVKDLAEWIIKMAEERKSGLYNATGPGQPLTFGNFINECVNYSKNDAKLIWADEKFLLDEGAVPWSELPMWVPKEDQGVNNIDISKAIKDGLTFRPIQETLKDTLLFDKSRNNHVLKAGLSPEKETELISKLKQRSD
ncbi:MAG: NAD-dependent epimerase/dehydratase family protein [bacterium]|nr:NAD-dependent epimerase/dehydratase family protein [bacterium]